MSAPALRFTDPDGNDYPAWTPTRLQEVAAIVGGGTPDSGNPSYWGGGIPWFTPTEIKSKHLTQTQRTLTPEGVSSSSAKMLPAGALLLSTRATVGEVGIATVPCCTNQGFQSLVVNADQDREFWYYWLGHNKDELLKRSAGSTFLEISKKSLGSIPANAPSLTEQRRIADALSIVDAKIDLLGRKRDALARFKAGLMQKLFSQEVRFTREDGSAYPDWEEKEIRDLLTICYGKDHKHLGVGNIPVYGTGGLMRYADTALHTGPSILIGRKGTIDKPRYVEGPFWTVDTVFYTKVKEGTDPFLLFSILQTVEWLNLNEASGVPSLNANTVGSVLITVPTDIYEQRQISAALSALDEKIEAVSRQIATMQAFKKGLLQQMFV